MHIFISMTSDLIIIDQTSFPHERATVIDYFPLHKTPVAANPSLSSLVHTWPHRPNRPKCNIALYIEHKNKMCRGACTLRYTKKIWGCPNSTCYTPIDSVNLLYLSVRNQTKFSVRVPHMDWVCNSKKNFALPPRALGMGQKVCLSVHPSVTLSPKPLDEIQPNFAVSCIHEWGVQWHNFFGPAPWGGAKRSNIIKFQLQSQFQRFLNQNSCVFSQRKDI